MRNAHLHHLTTFTIMLGTLYLWGCSNINGSELEPPEDAIGPVTAAQLLLNYPEFEQEYITYQPSRVEIEAINKIAGKSLLVLFGTWCHDSQREIPRLLKLLDESGVTLESLSLYAVNQYKQSPDQIHRDYNLRYTSTIILLDSKLELGRIIEKPKVSLGQDLAAFLSAEKNSI